MNFEAFNYAEKRVRSLGTREWKLWFSEAEAGITFRLLTKNSQTDCYVTVQGEATLVADETPIQEDDNGDAHPTDLYVFHDAEGSVSIYLELNERGLAWIVATGAYGTDECSFHSPGPLMPEIAG